MEVGFGEHPVHGAVS